MRIAIVGVGGVGGYYGAKLQAAGYEVCFIARGAQYRALSECGLKVQSATGDIELKKVEVYQDPTKAPKVDVALSCVKLYDAQEAAEICARLLQKDGIAVSLQNGIDGPSYLSQVLAPERTLAASVIISAFISEPGVIKHVDLNQSFYIEKRDGWATTLFEACKKAGFNTKQDSDPELILWKKFVRLVPISGVAVLCRRPMGFVRQDAHLRQVLQCLVAETAEIGRKKGISISDTVVEEVMSRIDDSPDEFKPSLLLDLERGKKLEASWLTGRVVRLGRELGMSTPYNDCVWASLSPYV